MSSFLRKIVERIDYLNETKAPLNTDGARTQSGVMERDLTVIRDLVVSPPTSLSDLPAFLDAVKGLSGTGIDDRKLLASLIHGKVTDVELIYLLQLERILVVMSRTRKLDISQNLQQVVINLLYKDLPHPPSGYLSLPPASASLAPLVNVDSPAQGYVKYAFRSADGSNYNTLFPNLGKAGMPYARSVPSTNISPKSALPDAGLVFDTLLKRDKFVEHPGGISSLFFAFADLVIHSIFNTNHTDWTINDASSYLDLSVLYGNNEAQVNSVRRHDGSGRLLDDVFADSRLLLMPPAACALLILLNRNHNFIAQRILDINENGNLVQPYPIPSAMKAQDDEIFHRARLVNCGYFMKIILGDYVGAILGLVRDGSDWRLDPLMTMRGLDHEFVPTGEGNVVSVEFNLLYRWHATLSQPDTTWTTNTFQQVFEGADLKDVTIQDFKRAAHKNLIPPANLQEWTFNGLKRGPDHRFRDEDLANILHNAIEARAGAFKARGVPEALRVIEVMGIEQSRSWGICSLNEFRKFLGLRPYSTFKEWNPDPEIHSAAAALYKDIDNLELHVGLQAEEPKSPGDGAGLCPGYTISRAILADAVSLSRGDRFMTVDFTPFNSTAWGYQDCQYDPQDGSYGGLLTKLLFRTLPDHYPRGSAYAHFPFLVPSYMKSHLESSNPTLVEKYTWTRPRQMPPVVSIDTFDGVKNVLDDTNNFVSSYDGHLFTCVKPILVSKMAKDTLKCEAKTRIAFDLARRKFLSGMSDISKSVFAKPEPDIAMFFAEKTKAMIRGKQFRNGGSIAYLDIVKDVINVLPIHWISQEIIGLPLKSEASPTGAWYEQDLYNKFAEITQYVYLNFDPADDWRLREASQDTFRDLVEIVKAHIDKVFSWASLSDAQNHIGIENYNCHAFLKKLMQTLPKNKSNSGELAAQVVAAIVPTAALYSQALTQVIDFYLNDNQETARLEIVRLVNSSEEGVSAKVMVYVYEALRLNPPVAGVYRTAMRDTTVGPFEIKAGHHIFASILSALSDTRAFGSDPKKANFTRSSHQCETVFFGMDGLLNAEFFKITVPQVLNVIFSLKGLQRAPGQSGHLTKFVTDWHGIERTQYMSQRGLVSPLPDSFIAQFDCVSCGMMRLFQVNQY